MIYVKGTSMASPSHSYGLMNWACLFSSSADLKPRASRLAVETHDGPMQDVARLSPGVAGAERALQGPDREMRPSV